jgi:hypothetical protein
VRVSNVFRDVWRFVPVVQRWKPGRRFSASLLNFHDCLLYLSFVFSTVRFENIPNSLFHDLRRMSDESVQQGREQATALKWIAYEQGYRRTYNYWFLDSRGNAFQPVPLAKPKPRWRYRADRWEMHLARQSDCREKPDGEWSSTIRKDPAVNHSVSGFSGQSEPQFPEKPESDSGEAAENTSFDINCLPLESLKPSEEVKNSDGVAPVLNSGKAECASPHWNELGEVRVISIRKKKATGQKIERARNEVLASPATKLKCWVHGDHPDWWKRSDGSDVCAKCHPRDIEKTQPRRHYTLAELQEGASETQPRCR